jgi:hypothetical protein
LVDASAFKKRVDASLYRPCLQTAVSPGLLVSLPIRSQDLPLASLQLSYSKRPGHFFMKMVIQSKKKKCLR